MSTFKRVYHINRKKENKKNEFPQTESPKHLILDSIVVSIPACHAGDRGSIPRRGDFFLLKYK